MQKRRGSKILMGELIAFGLMAYRLCSSPEMERLRVVSFDP